MGAQVSAFVVDNSVTMRWWFGGRADHMAYANAIREQLLTDESAYAVVPALWHIEAANTITYQRTGKTKKKRKARDLSEAECVAVAEYMSAAGIDTDSDSGRQSLAACRVMLLARLHDISAYDAAYLELAMRRALPLATNDEDLQEAARAAGVPLYLGGYEAFA